VTDNRDSPTPVVDRSLCCDMITLSARADSIAPWRQLYRDGG
jgi:hypothetical protein